MIKYMDRLQRDFIQANPDVLFVFGDNVAQVGLGGQAKECRGEPNSVGIPTKWRPSMDDDAFFSNDDFLVTVKYSLPRLTRIDKHLEEGGMVVWPNDGIGTGMAKLSLKAPKIAEFYRLTLEHWLAKYGQDL